MGWVCKAPCAVVYGSCVVRRRGVGPQLVHRKLGDMRLNSPGGVMDPLDQSHLTRLVDAPAALLCVTPQQKR